MNFLKKSYKELTVVPGQGKQVQARVFTALALKDKRVGSPITARPGRANDLDTGS
jgi:hypothetical protein